MYSLLLVSKKQIFLDDLPRNDKNLCYDWMSELEALTKINSKVKEAFDIIFVVDADKSVKNYLKYTELLNPNGILFVVFSPKKKVEEVEEELNKIKVFKLGDMILSRYHVLEFLKREHPEYNFFGAVLSIYPGKGAKNFQRPKWVGRSRGNLERFMADWIQVCREKFNAVPAIEPGAEKGILKMSYKVKNLDIEEVRKEFEKLASKHNLANNDVALRINLGGDIEIEAKREDKFSIF